MELQPDLKTGLVAYHHRHAVMRGIDREMVGQGGERGAERMIAPDRQRAGQAGKHSIAVMDEVADLAVNRFGRTFDGPPGGLDDGLMAKADADEWNAAARSLA